ncbi:ATP-grasp domain-containing protein [Bacillus thuringiensis]|uniref:ATP-grasp domain-containing protein n=1 Tax=Bacillus thuringiensis TaxID=1428 RepID=UPI0011A6C2C9|nr:ATP-grasp domain-containing protein [Bacillus thuringiensis]
MSKLHKLLNLGERSVVWFYNVNEEQYWNKDKFFPSINDPFQIELAKQQEQQLLILAQEGDSVIMKNPPDNDFLIYLMQRGFKMPKLIFLNKDNTIPWGEMDNEKEIFLPFIVTKHLYDLAHKQGFHIYGAEYKHVKLINNKLFTRKLAIYHNFNVTKGYFCESINELYDSYNKLCLMGFEKVVIKIPYGSSGKGIKIIRNAKEFKQLVKYIQKRNTTFEILIEGWYSNARSINAQLLIASNKVHLLNINEQIIDSAGVYLGTNFNLTHSSSVIENYKKEIFRIGQILNEMEYEGVLGIDSIIDEKGNIYPIIEINARLTQVTYLLDLVNKFSHDYSFIESRYIRIESDNEIKFKEVYVLLNDTLKPDEDNKFLIYVFAKAKVKDKYISRMFLLFYGNSKEKIKNMIKEFMNLKV